MGIQIIFLLVIIQILYGFGNARPLQVQSALTPVQIERSNSTNNVTIERRSAPKNGSMDATPLSRTVGNDSIRHIPRQRRALPLRSTDIHVVHGPCEFDLKLTDFAKMPFHCTLAFKAKFENEEMYKQYRLFQLEGFTFGQHYERFRRFETEQHTFEYRGTGLLD